MYLRTRHSGFVAVWKMITEFVTGIVFIRTHKMDKLLEERRASMSRNHSEAYALVLEKYKEEMVQALVEESDTCHVYLFLPCCDKTVADRFEKMVTESKYTLDYLKLQVIRDRSWFSAIIRLKPLIAELPKAVAVEDANPKPLEAVPVCVEDAVQVSRRCIIM